MTAAALASRAGNTDKAIRLYQRAAAADPKNTKALQSLAMLYISSGNWASAADTYEKAMAVADASETENYLQRLASCSFNAARFRTALDSYDKLSVLRRDDPDIWLGIAQSALGVSNLKRARYAAQKTLSLKNDCDEARLVLGCADYLDGKYLTALESFNKLVTDDKAGSFATFMVGRCYLKLGRTKQAQAAFDKATLTAPESPLVSIFLNETK
jgi:tetratricopeptide (TPR) repeat protein